MWKFTVLAALSAVEIWYVLPASPTGEHVAMVPDSLWMSSMPVMRKVMGRVAVEREKRGSPGGRMVARSDAILVRGY